MRSVHKFLALAVVGGAIGLFAQQALAVGPVITSRTGFSFMNGVYSNQVGDCGATGMLAMASGIDATGPFYAFDTVTNGTPIPYTYRPRNDDCGSCNVGYFGDGGIAAVRDFREMYERFKRSANPFIANQPQPCGPAYVSMGGGTSCTGPCQVALTLTPRDIMTGPNGIGTGGAFLVIAANPTTYVFEDFKFEYSVFN